MPPFETPVDASELLAFTPASLSDVENPPVFHLRAATARDQRQHRRMMREEGLTRHSDEEIRSQTRKDLKALWSPEIFNAEIARLDAYWEALDNWALQVKDDPELKFDWPQEELEAIDRLSERLLQASIDLRRMYARNADASEMQPVLVVATIVKSYEGLDAPLQREAGYLTVDCAYAMRDALAAIERKAKRDPGLAFVELMVACVQRMKLDGGEEKNSASPSPNEPTPPNSKVEAGPSKSPASAKSTPKTSAA